VEVFVFVAVGKREVSGARGNSIISVEVEKNSGIVEDTVFPPFGISSKKIVFFEKGS